MVINQAYAVVNEALKQARGEKAVSIQNLNGLISTGKEILSSQTSTDAFLNALVDRIYKTIISNRAYEAKTRGLMFNSSEWGVAIQEVYVESFEASENAAYKVSPSDEPIPFNLGTHTKPRVKVKIYSNRDTWKFTVSIPENQIKTAFLSNEGLSAFIAGIFTEMNNAISESIEDMVELCEANFIAEKLVAEANESVKGIHAINILKKYKTDTGEGANLTAKTCRKDTEFWRYFGKEVKRTMKFMARRTRVYNTEGYVRNVPEDELRIHMLGDVASSYATYLEADTFNKELLALPGYEEIDSFQGIGLDTSFEEVSKIHVNTAKDNKEVEQTGIACVLFDPMAMGVIYEDQGSSAAYDNEHRLTKYWFYNDLGMMNNLSRNAVVFYIADDDQDYVAKNKVTSA